MTRLSEFLKHDDLYLTLLTEDGERYDAGIVDYVKPYNTKTILRWDDVHFAGVKRFVLAVLHNNKSIFDGFYIRPFTAHRESVIQLEYSRDL